MNAPKQPNLIARIKARVGLYLRTHRKAVAGVVTQAATVAIAWVVLHSKLNVSAETLAWITATAGSAITGALVSLFPNDAH